MAITKRLENIGSAAAGIAHDINNQLTLIVNHLAVQNPEGVLAAVARCSALAGSLLASARGDAIALRPLDHGKFLRGYLAGVLLPEGVRLVAEVPASLPSIAADAMALERALTNLILNACAAMGNSGTLRVTASPQQIEIADSGPGIPTDIAARVFEPFFSTKGAEGNGLGLSIVRDIMRQHCGSVAMCSQPGHGARFTLRFRAVQQETGQGKTGFNTSPRKIAPAA